MNRRNRSLQCVRAEAAGAQGILVDPLVSARSVVDELRGNAPAGALVVRAQTAASTPGDSLSSGYWFHGHLSMIESISEARGQAVAEEQNATEKSLNRMSKSGRGKRLYCSKEDFA
jgi:hypothetical protein